MVFGQNLVFSYFGVLCLVLSFSPMGIPFASVRFLSDPLPYLTILDTDNHSRWGLF